MSCFTVEILEPSGNILEIESCAGSGTYGVTVTQSGDVHNLSVSQCMAQLPVDIIDIVHSEIDGYLIEGSGISLTASSGNLIISTTGLQPSGNYITSITSGSGIDVVNDGSIYTISLTDPTIQSSDITDFNIAVSSLLPVKNILAGSNISVIDSSGVFTVAVTGQLGLTGEEVDDRVNSLLVGVSGINLSYNDNLNTLTISTTGLQPSGNYANTIHYHTSGDITDFNSAVSGLLPITILTAGTGIDIQNSGSNYTISVTGTFGLTSEQVDDRVSSLLNAGSGIALSYDDNNDLLVISTTGLQPSGNYSVVGHAHIIGDVSGLQLALDSKQPSGNYASSIHSHISSDITDFNSSVSGLLTPYALLNSPSFSGTPTVPTAPSGTNTNQIASTSFVRTEISNLIDSSPSTLDTLNELAAALGDDANFSTTVTNSLSQKANLSGANFSGLVTAPTGNFGVLQQSGVNVSISGHTHSSSDITNFNSSVSGLLPSISGSGYVNSFFDNNTYTISVSGLQPSGNYSIVGHTHSVNDIINFSSGIESEVSTLLTAGSYINLFYDDNNDSLTISATGLQPSGNYSLVGHTHTSTDITDFSSGVSGLLPVKNILGSGYVNVSSSSGNYTVSVSGLQPSGNYSVVGHTHTASNITDFNSVVSGLLPSVTGSGYVSSSFSNNIYTLSVSGLQPSGNYSVVGHTHTSNDISDFNNSVSGLLPVKDVVGSGYISASSYSGIYTISATGLQPSGNYSIVGHTHTSSNITDFSSSVSGLLPSISGIDYIVSSFSNNTYNISVTGLQPSGNYSIVGHTHIISEVSGLQNALDSKQPSGVYASGIHTHLYSDITDFNSGVSGLLPSISGSGYVDSSFVNNIYTISVNGLQPSGNYSLVGHNHNASDITDFSSSVSGLLPVTDILGGSNITIDQSGSIFTVSVTGSLGLTTEEVDDRVSQLLIAGSGITLNYNDSSNVLTIDSSATTSLVAGTGISLNYNQITDQLFINTSGVSLDGHTHLSSNITDFNNSVSGLLPSVSGSGYVSSNFTNNIYTISVSGLQPSGNYSLSGHTHTVVDITDFNSSVSGLLPVKDILSGTGISISSTSGIYTINSTGSGVLADQASALVTTVFNNTGSPIPKMSAVYINGGQGDLPTVSLAIATSDMTSAGTYGLTYETISNMQSGKVIVFGALTGLDTDQFNPTSPHGNINGTILYLSPYVSGTLTTSKPSAPNHIVAIGTVVRTHQNEGVIEVRAQNGFELEELHNVAISGVTNGQFLQYNSGSGLWVPSSSGNFTSLSVNSTGVSLNGHSHTSSNITDFNSSVSGLLPVTNIVGGANIDVVPSGSTYTISVSGSLGLTTEEVDDRVSSLLIAGTGISLNYNDNFNTLTINTSGLQPSGNYSVVGHNHNISDITDFPPLLEGYNSFETVSKNLKAYPVALNYTSGVLTSLVYILPSGTITKTLTYTSGVLTSITLSGAVPPGINLTKNLVYTSGTLTSINYS